MKTSKYKFFIFVNLIILFNSLNSYFLAQTKQNSIIKLFCLQSVKEEMIKAEMLYSKEIANETCDCYYEEFMQTACLLYTSPSPRDFQVSRMPSSA